LPVGRDVVIGAHVVAYAVISSAGNCP
jgi:hypothetical protein